MKKLIVAIIILIMGAGSSHLQAQCRKHSGIKAEQIQQHRRVEQGIISGELTRKETVRLRVQQGKIRHDRRLAKADGVVTPYERVYIKNEQARASRNIYRQKHNRQER